MVRSEEGAGEEGAREEGEGECDLEDREDVVPPSPSLPPPVPGVTALTLSGFFASFLFTEDGSFLDPLLRYGCLGFGGPDRELEEGKEAAEEKQSGYSEGGDDIGREECVLSEGERWR